MLGDFLLSFFLGMPAIVAVLKSREMTHPLARAMLFWGGLIAVGLIAMVILPMLACDGSLMSDYSNCIGGDGMAALFTKAQPVLIMAGKIYILLGVPLGILAFLLESARGNAGKA